MTEVNTPPGLRLDRVEPVDIQSEMQRSYMDYAMSVIVSRALPDVRDGLKPVHRRVLYAMYDGGYRPDRGYFKCSRVVGDVMGSYHPHGDSLDLRHRSCDWRSPGRCATRWSTGRATSARRATTRRRRCDTPSASSRRIAMEMLRDIDKDTVDFQPNYDGRSQEPDGPAGALPEPAGQRLGRHRGRHGDQHPAAQPARGRATASSGAWRTPRPPTRSSSKR